MGTLEISTRSALQALAAVFAVNGSAAAQTAHEQTAQMDTIVVTGTRSPGRTALESSVPIDVIGVEQLRATGFSDLAQALEYSSPAVNFPRAHTTPSSANTRPITLRGLSPDEVLVLINGKRWHTSAVINTNFAVGRGSAPFDLGAIPLSAIDHVEILRDGAAAQYGSDAIGGVINIILNSADQGGLVQAGSSITDRGDGLHFDGSANKGWELHGGFLNLTADATTQRSTNRAGVDQRYGRVTYLIGDPDAKILNLAANASVPVGAASDLYATALVSRKDSVNAAGFRTPGTSPLFPAGFRPLVNPLIWDVGGTVGLRGRLFGEFAFDLSNTFGLSNADISVRNSANTSLGADSPARFDAGTARYAQNTTNFNLSRPLDGWLSGGNFAAGLEYRWENYRLRQGEPASYFRSGAAGFPGFNPRIPVDNGRNAAAAYVDLEIKPAAWLTLGAAARYDHYSDFGSAPTGKLSARVQADEHWSLRASVSNGFRAPSLPQQYYSSLTSVANGANKEIVNVGTYQVRDPVAQALGATPLRAEKSRTATAGIVYAPSHDLSFTADFFRTDIDHRIALSDALGGPAVLAALRAAGITDVQQAAFFTNALDTRTQGYEVTANYRTRLDEATSLQIKFGYGHSPTTIRSTAPNPMLPALPLLSEHSLLLLTSAQPENKATSQFSLTRGGWNLTLDLTRYGKYVDAPILSPQTFGAKTVADLSVSTALGQTATLTLGVLNLGNVYPDKLAQQDVAFKSFGGSFLYGEESPFGISGRTYYARLKWELP
ncbi:MAG: TonB-dependent receptor [Rudaea sp.]|uniref:TonB-dependent receptor plug domain-containing protein n=1 Tax=unclassified Rudaea TaxID=2627037 RepID=UPI0010F7DE7E|nr:MULTISPECIES: TonB-dependent receptor [unclassified Rudaea]MBN8886251.1 TonB-dependent receptor [Rudaea sp.]